MFRYFTLLLIATLSAIYTQGQRLNEYYYRAQSALHHGEFDLAVSYIDTAIQTQPRNPLVWLKKGEIYCKSNQFGLALESYQKAEEIRTGIALYPMARAYALMGNSAIALEILEQHLLSTNKEHESTILLDTAFQHMQSSKEWADFWLNDWFTPYERFLAEVEYHKGLGELDIALELLEERMQGRKSRHQLYALRGEIYHLQKMNKAADKDLKNALNSRKKDHTYLALRAKILWQLEKHGKALSLIDKAIVLSGGKPHYYFLRSGIFASEQRYQKAREDIKFFLSYYPNEIEAQKMYALYSIHSGNSIEALLQLGRLIKSNPTHWENYFLRSTLYMETQKWEMAILDLNQSIELNPNHASSYLNRGICHRNVGNVSAACIDWEKAKQMGEFHAQELLFKYCRKNI